MHIPFCDSKCHYCNFNSFTKNHHLKQPYMQALQKQLLYELQRLAIKKHSLTSLYIGGGTPSTIEAKYYEPIFALLLSYLQKDAEITVEANPNSATKEWLAALKELGANRISFGVQSFDNHKLKFLGRAHTPSQATKAVENAFSVGFANISIDLIYDCSIDTKELLAKDIKIATSLPINHISTYSLIIEPNTPFEGKAYKKNDERLDYFLKELIPFEQYEVSNYGSYRSTHNMGYWRLLPYIGVGAGAVGFWANRRYYPPKDLLSYMQDPLQKEIELVSEEDIRTEKIFLGLRSCIGVQKSLLDPQKIALLLEAEKITQDAERIYNKNYFIADEIALFLL